MFSYYMKTTNITIQGKTKNKKNILISDCIFPFNYRCKKREKCVHGENGNWCATKLTPRGFTDKWAFCASKNEKKNVSKDLKYINRLVKSKLKTIKSPSKKSVKRLLSKDLKAINRLVKSKLKTMKIDSKKDVSKDLKYINRLVKSKLKTMKSPSKKTDKRLLSKDLKAINRLVKSKLKTPKQYIDIDNQRGRTLQRKNHKTANRRRSNPPTRQTAKAKKITKM
jgi:oligoribonuclease (3'-5' exoribonuclease)